MILYSVIIILMIVIIIEIIFFYISNIRTITVVKKQASYIVGKLFNHLSRKKYSFFADNYSGKIAYFNFGPQYERKILVHNMKHEKT